jgi:branched-chain amino acid aminotransferase
MTECYGNSYIFNGEIQPAGLFDNASIYEGESIYEVLRIFKGTPVFFFDHINRLETSVSLQGKKMLANRDTLKNDIVALLLTEKKREINIKIVFNFKNGSGNYLVYFIESVYPTQEQYKNGVKGLLFSAERKDPQSKVINHRLRSEIYHRLILEGAYEALLVNNAGCITEGSRSNIFFIKDDRLYTASEEAILNGITRKHILDICRENNIPVDLTCVNAKDIQDFESAIMTGTSPAVLPFNRIGNTRLNVKHHLISLLRSLYLIKAEESMRNFLR